jgi:hypothetical protein
MITQTEYLYVLNQNQTKLTILSNRLTYYLLFFIERLNNTIFIVYNLRN